MSEIVGTFSFHWNGAGRSSPVVRVPLGRQSRSRVSESCAARSMPARSVGLAIACGSRLPAQARVLPRLRRAQPDRRGPSLCRCHGLVIVGSGPQGLGRALRLPRRVWPRPSSRRGKPVRVRRADLASLHRGQLNPESNYCFGEGGAGTYSDGKLYTRSKDRVGVAGVLADLVALGAPADITIDARPHIGSNLLRGCWRRCARVCRAGRALPVRLPVHGPARRAGDGSARCRQVPEKFLPIWLCWRPGHSARDVYTWAAAANLALQRKDIAVGFASSTRKRSSTVFSTGRAAGHPRLPPAFYEVRAGSSGPRRVQLLHVSGRLDRAAATELGGLVVNGMSLAKRNSPFANAALVVTVAGLDFGRTPAVLWQESTSNAA